MLNDFNLLQWGFNRLIPARSPYSGVNMSLGMAAPKQRFIGSLSAGFCACGAGPRGFESRRFRRFELPTYTLFACRVIRISGSSVERRELVDVNDVICLSLNSVLGSSGAPSSCARELKLDASARLVKFSFSPRHLPQHDVQLAWAEHQSPSATIIGTAAPCQSSRFIARSALGLLR